MKYNLLLISVSCLIFSFMSCQQDFLEETPDQENKGQLIAKSSPSDMKDALKNVDQLPLFGGCHDSDCSNQKLINFVQENLVYPKEAKSHGIEGRVFVHFVVEVDGSVSNIMTQADPGSGLGQAAVAMIEKMNQGETKWSSGLHQDKKVPVKLTLPVTYRI